MVLITIIGLIVNYIPYYLRLQFLLQPSGIMIIWIRNTTKYLQSGWVSFWIKGEKDIPQVIELFKMGYDYQVKTICMIM